MWSTPYDANVIAAGSDSFWVSYDRYGPIDWDLYLVDESTGDTCYWHNRNPDWGVENVSDDDPLFVGDSWGFGYEAEGRGDLFSGDRVSIHDAAQGSYVVYVRYFDGPTDSASAMPRLSIELGMEPDDSMVGRYYQNSPDRPLLKGEVWYAGRVSFPDGRYDPRDQRIISPWEGVAKAARPGPDNG
jgi:hypothetical protein